jgi:hypothetical protein
VSLLPSELQFDQRTSVGDRTYREAPRIMLAGQFTAISHVIVSSSSSS